MSYIKGINLGFEYKSSFVLTLGYSYPFFFNPDDSSTIWTVQVNPSNARREIISGSYRGGSGYCEVNGGSGLDYNILTPYLKIPAKEILVDVSINDRVGILNVTQVIFGMGSGSFSQRWTNSSATGLFSLYMPHKVSTLRDVRLLQCGTGDFGYANGTTIATATDKYAYDTWNDYSIHALITGSSKGFVRVYYMRDFDNPIIDYNGSTVVNSRNDINYFVFGSTRRSWWDDISIRHRCAIVSSSIDLTTSRTLITSGTISGTIYNAEPAEEYGSDYYRLYLDSLSFGPQPSSSSFGWSHLDEVIIQGIGTGSIYAPNKSFKGGLEPGGFFEDKFFIEPIVFTNSTLENIQISPTSNAGTFVDAMTGSSLNGNFLINSSSNSSANSSLTFDLSLSSSVDVLSIPYFKIIQGMNSSYYYNTSSIKVISGSSEFLSKQFYFSGQNMNIPLLTSNQTMPFQSDIEFFVESNFHNYEDLNSYPNVNNFTNMKFNVQFTGSK